MRTSLSSKGQIVLPAEMREQDSLRAGQQFEVERIEAGEYRLKKIPDAGRPGLLQWLLACPEKGWFQRIPSDSTADL
jgi:AbrB family looped-hinge helix DNA binding protein